MHQGAADSVTDPAETSSLVVVVTGASSGIGRATAVALSSEGAQVVLAARSRAGLLEAARECAQGSTLVVPTDVSQAEQVDALFAAAVDRYGRVDAVVHSAAVLAYGRFEDVPGDVFDAAIGVTLLGTATVARAALRQFSHQGAGSLVVVGSLLGKIAVPYMSSYVTAKWGVHGLVRCLQIEARRTPDVHVSLVWPGSVNTPVYAQAGSYLGRHGRPPPPVVSPERVARVIAARIEHPGRQTSVGPANALSLLGFRFLPDLFDALVTPLMGLVGISSDRTGPTAGNVFEPQPAGEATHGKWCGGWARRLLVAGRRAAGSLRDAAGARDVRAGANEKGLDLTPDPGQAGKTRVTYRAKAPATAVWAVLSDGWLYANWVVGASRIRDVDPAWPAAGSRIHHSVGVWPALVDDETVVTESVPERRLVLQAKGWPLGEARVFVQIDRASDDTCDVSIVEDVVKGPGRFVPKVIRQPLIAVRNREALRRLALIAQGRRRQGLSGP